MSNSIKKDNPISFSHKISFHADIINKKLLGCLVKDSIRKRIGIIIRIRQEHPLYRIKWLSGDKPKFSKDNIFDYCYGSEDLNICYGYEIVA